METSSRYQVESVAALTWLSNRIESLALECYIADPEAQASLTKILLEAINQIEALSGSKGFGAGDCPEGWCSEANRCVPCMDPR